MRVIDLVTGDQPIANEDGSVHVVLNGEIYFVPEPHSIFEFWRSHHLDGRREAWAS